MDNETGNSATLLSLPTGNGGLRGLGESFQPDLYTGSGSYQVTLELPPAQNGFRPDLFLRYGSGAGTGAFGLGWDLSVLGLQRSCRRGFPAYDETDRFVLAGGEELVAEAERYRPGVDTKGWQILRDDAGWSVTTKDGTVHRLGRTKQARLDHPGGLGTFAWRVEEIETPFGQIARYRYRAADGELMLQEIAYGPFHVLFEYEDRPDKTLDRRAGFRRAQTQRCREIRIESERSPLRVLRRYRLEYSAASTLSLLTRIVLEAPESHGHYLAMPDLRFGYGAWDPARSEQIEVGAGVIDLPPPGEGTVDLMDLDGSGRPAIVRGTATGWSLWANLGAGAFGDEHPFTNAPVGAPLSEATVRFLDLEGNGSTDLLWQSAGAAGFFPNAAGGEWGAYVAYPSALPFDLYDATLRFCDADGDGRIDAISSTGDALLVFTNLGRGGWSPDVLRVPRNSDLDIFPDVSFSDPGIFIADMTGDGLPDVISVRSGQVAYWPCVGKGRWGGRVVLDGSPVFDDGFNPVNLRLADLNGNGLADLVYLENDRVRYWMNNLGQALGTCAELQIPGLTPESAVVTDLLGRGHNGIFWSLQVGEGRIIHRFTSFGGRPDDRLLTTISSGLGHVTRIDYGASVAHRERDERDGRAWKTFLPFCLSVVDRITNIDGPAGITARTAFAYHDGHYDGIERAFNGFGAVGQSNDGDESVPTTCIDTVFHPGTDPKVSEEDRRQMNPDVRLSLRALRGSPLITSRSEVSATGELRVIDRTTVAMATRLETNGLAGSVVVPYSTGSVSEEFDGLSPARRTSIRRGPPDAHLNPTWTETEFGVVAADGGYTASRVRRAVVKYVAPGAVASTYWTPGLVCEQACFDSSGVPLMAARFYYDGPDFVGLPFGQADRGGITRVEELVVDEATPLLPDVVIEALGYHKVTGSEVSVPGWYRNRSRTRRVTGGQVVVARDPLGNDTAIDYDDWGLQPIRVTDAVGCVTTATYDLTRELPNSITNADGITERRSYDALGRTRCVHRTGPTGNLDLFAVVLNDDGDFAHGAPGVRPPAITTVMPTVAGYDPDAILSAEQPLSLSNVSVLRRYYGASGAELETVSTGPGTFGGGAPMVHSGERRFNVTGAVKSEGVPRLVGGATFLALTTAELPYRHNFDGSGREVRLVFPGGERQQQFDPFHTRISDAQTVLSKADANVDRVFDASGKLVEVHEAISETELSSTGFAYGLDDRLVGLRDPRGNVVQEHAYDRLGRLVRTTHRDAGTHLYVYDAAGKLTHSHHPSGSTTAFTYDASLRPAKVVVARADGTVESTRRFHFDRSPDGTSICPSRLCAIGDDAGLTILDYGVDGRLAGKRRTTPAGRRLALTFERDFRGQVTAITYPNGLRVAYGYGASGEIQSIEGFIDAVAYDARGRPLKVTYANGLDTAFTYDATERLAVMETRRAGQLVARFEQDYDAVGNPVRIAARLLGQPPEERRLRYDRLNRLVASSAQRQGAAFDFTFSYDLNGNITSNTEHGVAEFLYEDAARPGLLTGMVMTDGAEHRARRYDTAGRLVANESLAELVYDGADRLVAATTHTGVHWRFSYDSFGARCRSERGSQDAAEVSDHFDDLFEGSEAGGTIYVRGFGGLIGVIELSGARRTFHQDPQGSVRLICNEQGRPVATFSYTSFGLDCASVAVAGYFNGKVPDDALGLVQLGARFYDPLVGRFTTPDQLILERPDLTLTDPSALNLYAYCLNNPHRYRDPSGRFAIIIAIIVGAIIGGILGYNAAKENNKDPLLGALIGAIIGGLAGGATGFWARPSPVPQSAPPEPKPRVRDKFGRAPRSASGSGPSAELSRAGCPSCRGRALARGLPTG
jgi:RHS repeat-associated protein